MKTCSAIRDNDLTRIVKNVHIALGYYPARFPYHIAVNVLQSLEDGWTVLDPFVGSGVSCTSAIVTGHGCIGFDINPFAVLLARASTTLLDKDDVEELDRIVHQMEHYKGQPWIPDWENIHYWHPKEALEVLGKLWAYVRQLPESKHSLIIKISLARVTRELSYADPDIPKLYRGKKGVKRAKNLIASLGGKEKLRRFAIEQVKKRVRRVANRLLELTATVPDNSTTSKVIEWNLVASPPPPYIQEIDAVFTSPPYLAAHEYIRSTKLELFWLGYTKQQIRNLSKMEIPYARVGQYDVKSRTYNEYLEKIASHAPQRVEIYKRYFWAVTRALDSIIELNPKVIAIFVGEATLGGIPIPVHEILREHIESRGYREAYRCVDKVKVRKLFRRRNNKNPNGIRYEHLIILKI